jgi:phosphoethanolamine N-methyltransferase
MIAEALQLTPNDRILDVGCGLGGFAFYFAKHFDVQVTGIELAEEIVKLVQERAVDLGLSDKVNFLLQDAVLADFESETFSIIHFGESLMHFKHEDKVPMLKKVKKWLKPGGQLIIRDICTSDVLQTSQNEFKQFCSSANYHFLKIAEYCQVSKCYSSLIWYSFEIEAGNILYKQINTDY